MRRVCLILGALFYIGLLNCSGEREPKDDAGTSSDEGKSVSPEKEAGAVETRDSDTVDATNSDPTNDGPSVEVIDRCPPNTEILRATIRRVEKIDILFVVDNSKSMDQEQQKLREQFPIMIKALTTGDSDGDGETDFPPATDLHLAVVSSDMGLPGLGPEDNPDTTGACAGFGDDGMLLNDPTQAIAAGLSCPQTKSSDNPIFLEHIRDEKEDTAITLQSADDTASAFACAATLGVSGCGFEMQLESALKALWPDDPDNQNERQKELAISFLEGTPSHGDSLHKEFLRGTPYHPTEAEELSLLAIVVVTDEEDCSAGTRGNVEFLSLNFPGGDRQDLNLRCYKDTINDWGNKYPVERYVEAFKALRPEHEQLMVFAGIVGVPVDIKDDENGDGVVTASEHAGYFERLLSDRDMQETVSEDTNNLEPSCVNTEADGTITTQAYPPRRLVEVAQQFGQKGVVHSICQDDFRPAIEDIVRAISYELGSLCIEHELARDENGMIPCDVVWEMPPGLDCDEEYLTPHEKPFSEKGRAKCVVNQLAVDIDEMKPKEGYGWFWDDFSEELQYECKKEGAFRVAFVLNDGVTSPPIGTTSILECPDECVIIQ